MPKAQEIPTKERLIAAIKDKFRINDVTLKRALKKQSEENRSISEILIREGILSETDLSLVLSEEFGIPTLNLSALKIDPQVMKLVPKKFCELYQLIPISKIGNSMTVALSDPFNLFAIDEIKQITHLSVRPVIVTPKAVRIALETFFSEHVMLEELFADVQKEMEGEEVEVLKEEEERGEEKIHDEAPVIKAIDLILEEALAKRASDIHMEPYEDRFRVRFRIDGVLREVLNPPKELSGALIARLKIISNLNISEKRLPQDGRFRARIEGRDIDFRLSILPSYFGEKAVMRLLDKSNVNLDLKALGFLERPLEMFSQAIQKPYGMILVTGPTGSGKSTTLYSILNGLNAPERHILTIEDPIEYQLEGVTQTQVSQETGYTFASGLRSLLRQSPDIILVGEIRDQETADIAVKAALTGHLVFSTLHTNSAAGAITRLVDMDVEPFLISSSLVLVTAQRLCRRICPHCKEPLEIPKEVLHRLHRSQQEMAAIQAFHGKGCTSCSGTGYRGRIAATEALMIDDEIRTLILRRASSDEIEKLARDKGMETLYENAFEVFRRGLTTLEEVLRVAFE